MDELEDGKMRTVTDAIDEVGFTKPDDVLPIPNRITDVRELTNLVRYTTYAVGNMAAVLSEDKAVAEAGGAILQHATAGLSQAMAALDQVQGKK